MKDINIISHERVTREQSHFGPRHSVCLVSRGSFNQRNREQASEDNMSTHIAGFMASILSDERNDTFLVKTREMLTRRGR